MDFASNLVEGRFKVRLNRFLALVDVKGQEVAVHVPNTGRMRELLVPGYRVWKHYSAPWSTSMRQRRG